MMKPLAVQFRLVIDDHKRLAYEVEFIFDNGVTVLRKIDANTPQIIHFEDLQRDAENARTPD